MNADLCLSVRTNKVCHNEIDLYGRENRLTITFAPWHPNPQYNIFQTGSLLSRNEQYPSGLIIVNELGIPSKF